MGRLPAVLGGTTLAALSCSCLSDRVSCDMKFVVICGGTVFHYGFLYVINNKTITMSTPKTIKQFKFTDF